MYSDKQARANSVDPDQTPQNAASNQGLHCLPLIQQFYTHSQVLNGLVEEKYKVKCPKFIKCIQNFLENEILS